MTKWDAWLKHHETFKMVAISVAVIVLYAGVLFLFMSRASAQRGVDSVLTPREYLRAECQQPDCDFLLLDAIVTCESRWRMIQNSVSSAYGYFQILDSTEKTTQPYKEGERKYNPYSNIDMGIFLYNTRGSNPWNESRHCWQPKYRYATSRQKPTSVGELQLTIPEGAGTILPQSE